MLIYTRHTSLVARKGLNKMEEIERYNKQELIQAIKSSPIMVRIEVMKSLRRIRDTRTEEEKGYAKI